MLLLAKRISLISFAFMLGMVTSCGFKPLSEVSIADEKASEVLLSIYPSFQERNSTLEEEVVYNALKKKIRRTFPATEAQAEYLVYFKNFTHKSSGVRIDNDGNFTTYKMYAAIDYEMRKVGVEEMLATEKMEVNTNYNIDSSIYVTEVAERETIGSLLGVLVGRLSSSFILTIACN